MGMEPYEIAQEIINKPEPERLQHVTDLLEMVRAAIVIRSACRDKMFVNMSGNEDAGTKFDRLMKELFGMEFKDTPKPRTNRKSASSSQGGK